MITLARGVAPEGAVVGGRTAKETLQVIGEPPLEVPESISADIGITDVHIYNRGGEIEFARGLRTDVGKRIPSNTQGITVSPESAFDIYGAEVLPERRVRPIKKVKHTRPKKETWLDELTSLAGMRW